MNVKLFTYMASPFLWVGLWSCGQSAPPPDPSKIPVAVSTYTVSRGPATYADLYPGTVTSMSTVEIRGDVSGYIHAIFFKEGAHVKKGEKLYEIDQSKYLAAYHQAQSNLNISLANLDRAKKDYDRYVSLLKQDAIAHQQVDHAQTDLQNAKLQVAYAQDAVKSAQTDLNYSLIRAPFDGTIGLSQVKIGALVQPGTTLLNTISSDNPMGVDFVVDEKDIPRFNGYKVNASQEKDSIFTIVLPDRTNYASPGHIGVIDRSIDPQTGTVRVRLYFPNPRYLLKDGMSCTVKVLNGQGQRFMLIPTQSITEQYGEYFVYTIDSNRAHQKKISKGNVIGDKVIVKGGLKEGEVIVTEGTARLREGALVKRDSSLQTTAR